MSQVQLRVGFERKCNSLVGRLDSLWVGLVVVVVVVVAAAVG